MAEDREGFIFYRSFYECIRELPEADQAPLYDAIFDYSFNFVEPEFNGLKKSIWTLIRPLLLASKRNWENGKKPKTKKPKRSEKEATDKPKASESEGNKNKNKEDNKKEEENKDKEGEEKKEPAPVFGVAIKKWWHTATREILTERVYAFKDFYPVGFLDYFINYYSMESERAEMFLHEQTRFDIESKLKDWYTDPKTKDKYKITQQRMPDELSTKFNEDAAARIERRIKLFSGNSANNESGPS